MAMTKCKECNGQVSTTAKACPACGAELPRRTSALTWIVGGFFAVSMMSGLVMRANAPAPPAKTPQQIAEEARRNQQQTVAISAVSALRAGMKDPESFQLVSLAVKEDGAGCVTYRAKNSFNATLQASAVFVPGKKPKLLNESTDGNRFVAEWNKRCTVAGGEDVTDLAARLMAR